MKREFRKRKDRKVMGWVVLGMAVFMVGYGIYAFFTEEILAWILAPLGFFLVSVYLFVDFALTRLEVHQSGIRWISPFGSSEVKVGEVKRRATIGQVGAKVLFWRSDGSKETLYTGEFEDSAGLLKLIDVVFAKVPMKEGSEVIEGVGERKVGAILFWVIGLGAGAIVFTDDQFSGWETSLFCVSALASIGTGIWMWMKKEPTYLLERTGIVQRVGEKKTRFAFAQLRSVRYRLFRQNERVSETMYLEFENGRVQVRDNLSNYLAIRDRVIEIFPPEEKEEVSRGDQKQSTIAFVIAMGLFIFGTIGLHLWMAWPKLQAGVEPALAVGTVVDVDEDFHRVAFEVEGNEIVFKDKLGRDVSVGETVNLTYSTRNPKYAVADGSGLVRFAAVNAGVILWATGLIVLIRYRGWKRRQAKK